MHLNLAIDIKLTCDYCVYGLMLSKHLCVYAHVDGRRSGGDCVPTIAAPRGSESYKKTGRRDSLFEGDNSLFE